MKLWQLKRIAKSVRKKICDNFCDIIAGYHQDQCRFFTNVYWGSERRLTCIRFMIYDAEQKLNIS
jgi:hypothetical protein